MFARGLDVGQMSSTISGRHLADIDSMSGRCLKATEVRCRKRYRADIRPISERLDIGNDIGTISENDRG